MANIKNVAILGAGGNLGPAVLDALLDAGFNVTVLSRESSTSTFPSTIKVHKTDYSSESSLSEAFKGQDAVVSVVGSGGLAQQKKIVDAAVKAGVKRFIPSEYGINTQHLEGQLIGTLLKSKTETVEYLKKVASENKDFSWTGISTGLFFDWGLKVGSIGASIPNKTFTILDSGNEKFLTTNLKTIGAAIALALNNPQVANRYINIASFTTSQNEVLSILEAETGAKWTITKSTTDEHRKIGEEKVAKGDGSAFGNLLKDYVFRDGAGRANPEGGLANKELSLPEDNLRETIKSFL